jgi:hypothetical protein
MARTYKRDSRGRFSGGGGGGGRPAARGVSRGTNRLTRDNAGRITSVGGNGATARGGRLRTASGKKRATQTAKVSGGRAAGTTAKPRGLKPQSSRKLRTAVAVSRMRSINERMGNRPDIAEQNIRGRFSGQAGKRMDARIDRAVKEVRRAERERIMKPKAQVKAERAIRAKAKVRADKLRKVHENAIVSSFAAKHNKPKPEVRAAIRSMDPEKQVRFFKQYVKENRGTAKPSTRAAAAAAKRR